MTPLQILKEHFIRKRTAIKHISYLYLSNTVSSVSGFVVILILANSFTQHDYGNYKYVFSITGTLGVLALTSGFRNMAIQSAARGMDGVISYLFKSNMPLSIPMFIGGFIVGTYYLLNDNYFLGYSIIIATVCSIIGNNGIIAFGYLNGRKLYGTIFNLQLVQSVILVITLLSVTTFTKDVGIVLAANVLTTASVLTVFFLFVRTQMLRNNLIDKQVMRYGVHLNILGAMTTVMMNIDSILIFKIIGSQGLALYALATPFVDRIVGFLKATYFFALPKFTELGATNARRFLYKRCFMGFFAGLILYLMYYAAAPIIFEIFFPRYLDSVSLSRLFALNIPIIGFSIPMDAYIDSIMEARNKYILKGAVTTIRLTTLLILIYPFGVVGVIYSELITRISGVFITALLIRRNTTLSLISHESAPPHQ